MSLFWCVLALLPPAAAVADEEAVASVDFDTQLIPALTRFGCNTGACHGAAVGRGGFKLSLYGGDPAQDYIAITRELEGRRINPAHPDRSLLLRKPTGDLDHGGGYRFDADDPAGQLIRQWIEAGAARLQARKLTNLEITPRSRLEPAIPATFEYQVRATFDDGTARDVTEWTVFTTTDEEAIVLEGAQVTVRRAGWHVLTARYLDQVLPLEVIIPFDAAQDPSGRAPNETGESVPLVRRNWIDDHVNRRLTTLRIPVSPQVDDAGFLRRVHLDLTGRLPTLEQQRAFAADERPDKRRQWIAGLLASEEFVEYWTYRFAQLLRIRPPGAGQGKDLEAAVAYHQWLQARLREGTSFREVARELILAGGDTRTVGPANFYRTVQGPREQAELFSELFMGVRLRCANCHNHPLDQWTQDDYHGLAALFAGVSQGPVVRDGGGGTVIHPRTGEAAAPKLPGDKYLSSTDGGRETLATWLLAPDNPYFARAIVNRLWQAMMGRGLVEPVDDLRATNQATHPELLEALAEDFARHDYDLRHTLQLIAESAAYQRSSQPLDSRHSDDQFYSHALARALPAEVLADAIADVTGVEEFFAGAAPGTRAIAVVDITEPAPSLDILGRCDRTDSCEGPGIGASGGLSQKLHLINGGLLNQKIEDPEGRLGRLLAAETPWREVLETFYRLALSREPRADEWAYWESEFDQRPREEQTARLQDLAWSILSCREFTTNH